MLVKCGDKNHELNGYYAHFMCHYIFTKFSVGTSHIRYVAQSQQTIGDSLRKWTVDAVSTFPM